MSSRCLLSFLITTVIGKVGITFVLFQLTSRNYVKFQPLKIPAVRAPRPTFPTLANTGSSSLTSQSNLSPNYHLWSRSPHWINWSEPMKICESILTQRNTAMTETWPIFQKATAWKLADPHDDKSMADLLSDCNTFFQNIPFPNIPASKEESEYPLAYVVMGYQNVAQYIRLFRIICHPQNIYCLNYDNKSREYYKTVIIRLSGCFPRGNVFVSPRPEVIVSPYQYPLLHSQLVCLKALLDRWEIVRRKYVQIVSWNDFPLKTNAELVKIFKIFDGSQDCNLRQVFCKDRAI